MANELSSNWKKLQAQLKAEPAASSPARLSTKRKAPESAQPVSKRQKVDERGRKRSFAQIPKRKPRGKAQDKPEQMGTTQSSVVSRGSSSTVTPSLALWAEDNDISPEALAEAYGLGVKHNALLKPAAAADEPRVNEGLAPNIEQLGKYVSLDCEMVGVGEGGHESALARVSLVDFHGRQVYDSFVRPKVKVTDWRTAITGITPRHMAGARDFEAVQAEVAGLIEERILVGHDIRHDLAALLLCHPAAHIRDTSRLAGFRKYGHGPKPALRVLAKEVLGVEIQAGHHSSIEDARVTMLLFRSRKSEFDMEHANRYEKAVSKGTGKQGDGKKKQKKKR